MPQSYLSLFPIIFLLGLRHGIDWDHIAAITDVTGAFDTPRRGLLIGTMYALGHALVILILGLAAVLVGVNLPSWTDRVMQPLVGVTLILLGLFLLSSIAKEGKNFRFKSRWMVLFGLVTAFYNWLHQKLHRQKTHHELFHHPEKYGVKTAFIVGMIHGIGAETPTQVLLFVSAATTSTVTVGSLLVLTFVVGLVISNSIITVLSIFGYTEAKKNSNVYLLLGLATGVFSLVVGTMFLLGKANLLPAILGG